MSVVYDSLDFTISMDLQYLLEVNVLENNMIQQSTKNYLDLGLADSL